MSEALVALPPDVVEEVAVSSAGRLYVVSKRKFITLFIVTFGLYGTYWHYKQWSRIKASLHADSDDADIWPVMRAIFGVFFFHSLFDHVKQHSKDAAAVAEWKAGSHATLLVVTMLISSMLDRMAWWHIGAPVTDYLALASIAPRLVLLHRAQKMINLSCGDQDGAANHKLSAANYGWIAIGTVCWLLVVAGMLLPDSGTDAASFAGTSDPF